MTNQKGGMGRTEITKNMSLRPAFMSIHSKIEAYYNDDSTDNLTRILFVVDYVHAPSAING